MWCCSEPVWLCYSIVCTYLAVPAAEVVLFTAGLEDYAKPICDELDGRYGGAFHARLYRPATTACAAYPCLKVPSIMILLLVCTIQSCLVVW